jgi:hypothetical protein
MRRCAFLATLGGVLSAFLGLCASAQEGHFGIGHDKWHQDFYTKLRRNDGGGTCCNQMDCRPTQSRMIGDHYEVKVDAEWIPVPYDKIINVVAPDRGAHVCAPAQIGHHKGEVSCVILPPEG